MILYVDIDDVDVNFISIKYKLNPLLNVEVNKIVSKIVISVLCLVSMEQICVDV